ncbi:MAG: thioredoxin family protein [Haloferacaceae archaeon]
MSTEGPVDRLIDAGVFEAAGGDELRLAAEFRETVDDHRETLADRDPEDARESVAALTGDEDAATALCEAARVDPALLARYVAVRERVDDLTPGETLALAVVVGHLEDGRPRDDGSPDAFLPVYGDELVDLVALSPRCVVYAWREDCPPCDAVRGDFDAMFADGAPDDVMLLAVYGPDCPRLLDEEFDVVGAPTTLFTLEGSVDSRLTGARPREAYERELETLRERTLPSA